MGMEKITVTMTHCDTLAMAQPGSFNQWANFQHPEKRRWASYLLMCEKFLTSEYSESVGKHKCNKTE